MISRALLFVCGFGLLSERSFSKEPLSIKILSTTKQKTQVTIQIRAFTDVQLQTAELPWMAPQSFTFIVVPCGEGAGLRRIYHIQSPAIGQTTLKRAHVYNNTLNLTQFFPDIVRENKEKDLLFFWQ